MPTYVLAVTANSPAEITAALEAAGLACAAMAEIRAQRETNAAKQKRYRDRKALRVGNAVDNKTAGKSPGNGKVTGDYGPSGAAVVPNGYRNEVTVTPVDDWKLSPEDHARNVAEGRAMIEKHRPR